MNMKRLSVGVLLPVALVTLIAGGITLASGLLMLHWLAPAAPTAATPPAAAKKPATELFRHWPTGQKPDVVLMLTGQEHGYMQECGCSEPQLGGLARRYNLLQSLRAKGWPVVAVDLGDMLDGPQHRGPQTLLKYKKSMEALKLMNYLAVGVGEYETSSPTLLDVLAEYPLNDSDPPVLSSNLMDKQQGFANAVQSYVVSGGTNGSPKVGVAAIAGPTVIKAIPKQNPPVQFAPTEQVLRDVLRGMAPQKPEILVLLYQGTVEEAKACAGRFPEFHIVLCLTKESEPSEKPERVGNTLVVGVGHKGRYVGVMGAYRTQQPAKPFDFHYQLVALEPEFKSAPGTEKANPIMSLMEKYAEEVRVGNYLDKYPQRKHPLQVAYPKAEYVGSDKCKKCHEAVYTHWQSTPHSDAYAALEKATNPKNRQFDGECIVCHTVGFGYESGFRNEKLTAHLKNVGCESCHGPGSLHVAGNNRADLMALMNPFKVVEGANQADWTKRLNLIDQACQKCHDIDNDVHWDFKKKWPRIIHPDPTMTTPRGKDPFTAP